MEDLKMYLICKARRKYRVVAPASGKRTFDECFSQWNGQLFFWFNSEDNSTHVVATACPTGPDQE